MFHFLKHTKQWQPLSTFLEQQQNNISELRRELFVFKEHHSFPYSRVSSNNNRLLFWSLKKCEFILVYSCNGILQVLLMILYYYIIVTLMSIIFEIAHPHKLVQ